MPDASQWVTIPEIVRAARERLSDHVWDFASGGAETETTMRRNRAALEALALRPRVLRDMSQRSTTTSLLGIPLSLPVFLAPVGSVVEFDPAGSVASALAAEQAGTAAFIGSLSSPDIDEVAKAGAAPLFLQLYYNGDRAWTQDLVQRAEQLGYRGLCVTVDSAVYGRRERDITNRFQRAESRRLDAPDPATQPGPDHRGRVAATWQDIDWLRSITTLPVMLKGIMGAEDALLAVEHEIDVVYVSNHGGRQMDHVSATIEVLPEVVEAVAGRAEVVVDSGFVRGSDVLKALSLGARAVGIGKLMTWSLAAGGVPGLVRALELLQAEISTAMATLGVADVADLSPACVRPAVVPPPGTGAALLPY